MLGTLPDGMSERFQTVVTTFEPASGRLSYAGANAYGLILSGEYHRHLDGSVEALSDSDTLVLMSQGFVDCRDSRGERPFGTVGAIKALHSIRVDTPYAVADSIARSADAFCRSRYERDATVLALQVRAV